MKNKMRKRRNEILGKEKFIAKVFHPTTYKLLHKKSGFNSYESAMNWILKVIESHIGESIIDIKRQEKHHNGEKKT